MGLITKAIEKVENQENQPVPPEVPPKPKSKRKVVILSVILLLLGISLGGGYLFFLKPSPQVPPNVPRRSISARQQLSKAKPQVSQQNQDTLAIKAKEETKVAPERTLKNRLAQQKPKEPEKVDQQKEETSKLQIQPPIETALSQTPEIKEEKQTLVPEIKQPLEPVPPSTSDKKKETQKEDISLGGEKNLLSPDIEDILNTTQSSGKESTLAEGVPSSPLAESKKERAEKPDQVKTMVPGDKKTPAEESLLSSLPESNKRSVPKPSGIIDKSNSRAERFYNKGVSYHRQGDYDRAIDSYKIALSFDPGHQPTRMNLATAYLQTGRYKEAERELIYLYALRPLDPKVLFNFGLLLYQNGDHESAEVKLKKLLEFDSFNLEANLLLGSIYEEKGEVDQALELYMKAYRINSADARVLYKLGRASDISKDEGNAIKYYRLFLEAPGENGEELKSSVRDRLNFLLSQKEER
jgi:Flp pilus assembly protein TadD